MSSERRAFLKVAGLGYRLRPNSLRYLVADMLHEVSHGILFSVYGILRILEMTPARELPESGSYRTCVG